MARERSWLALYNSGSAHKQKLIAQSISSKPNGQTVSTYATGRRTSILGSQ